MDYLLFFIGVALILAIIFTEGALREKKNKRIYRQWLKDSFGTKNKEALSTDAIEKISMYHESVKGEEGDRFFIDDITWHDLAMDDIFSEMDTCCSVLVQTV